MMDVSDALSIEFLVTALVVVLVPGTGVIYTLSSGLFHGVPASVAAAFGCTLGIIPHLLASIMGLAALLHASAVAFQSPARNVLCVFKALCSCLRQERRPR